MQYQTFIKSGKAVITQAGLRCQGVRPKDVNTPCNKLLIKRNSANQIAGCLKCDRCHQIVEIEISVKQ
jgi:phage FluMu protein Com